MARPSRKGGKTSEAKTRKAMKGGRTTKTKRRTAPAANPPKRFSVYDLNRQLERCSDELIEAREQQAATAEILKVINASPGDLTPVFDIILEKAHGLCDVPCGSLQLYDDGHTRAVAVRGMTEPFEKFLRQGYRLDRSQPVQSGRPFQIDDLTKVILGASHGSPLRVAFELGGLRTVLSVPLVRDGVVFGRIVAGRQEVRPFSEHQIAVLQSFADQALIAIENARLFNETQEALERQTATADILKVIASSPSDVQPVFEAIAESAKRLLGSHTAVVTRVIDGVVHFAAGTAENEAALHGVQGLLPYPLSSTRIHAKVARTGELAVSTDVDASDLPQNIKEFARAIGWRSMLVVPMLRNGIAIGTIGITRREAGSFDDKTIGLLKTFADQAVIAIQNAQSFNETKEALERQTATAEILKVIASSPDDVQPVFNAIAHSAKRLIGGFSTAVHRVIDDIDHMVAFTPTNAESDEVLKAAFPRHRSEMPAIISLVENGETAQIVDSETADGQIRKLARARGWRSATYTPLMNQGTFIGFIVCTRREKGMLADHHVQLLRTFADQAVIAIENVRLFDEVQARTNDLTDALTYQTGSGNILRVIASSPTDVEPVLKAIVESACELCEADDALATLKDGDELVFQAQHGSIPVIWDRQPIDRKWTSGRAIIDCTPVHVHDLLAPEGEQFPRNREFARRTNVRTVLCVPLLRDGEGIGVIVLRRTEVLPFSDKQIALLQTFADQAVIAIGNVRMFEQVQARTRDLTESLEQQTATSEVLEVISASPGELQPVFQKMLENATRVCEANFGIMNLWDGEQFHIVADHNIPPAFASYREQTALRPHHNSSLAAIVKTHQAAQVHDLRESPGYLAGVPMVVRMVDVAGARTLMVVPMLKEDELVGAITIFRQEVRPFTNKQIVLVENFTKQAVIAIENTRLLKELRERTDALTRSLEELRTAQDRLIQTEKLASLGQLTAGIAHEIKNPLNFVNNFSALSAELTDELNDTLKPVAMDGKVREEVDELTGMLKDNLEKVVQHGKRANSIVKNMLLHSRQGSGEHRLADINAIVDESLNLAYHGARAEKPNFNVTMQRSFDPTVGNADIYPQEITRVLLNLISNGFYATAKRKTEAGDGFEPTVTATTKDLGDNIEIRIRDNGIGIPDEVKVKVFNPFFTTKPAGEGTGLGLSMSHDIIVKQHGGKIDVETEPGQFTEFRIVLPRTNNLTNKI